jgi:hypothetical protein
MGSDGETSREAKNSPPHIRRLAVLRDGVWIHPDTGIDFKALQGFTNGLGGAGLAVAGVEGSQIGTATIAEQADAGPAAGETAGTMAA